MAPPEDNINANGDSTQDKDKDKSEQNANRDSTQDKDKDSANQDKDKTEQNGNSNDNANNTSTTEDHHDPYYPPIITLPEVIVNSGEENEEELFRMRAKLFRFESGDGTEDNPPEWKERGTGDVKLLKHRETEGIRILMRRDKTLKLCANHAIQPWMQLKPNCGSDRAFVWSVQSDFADEEEKAELLAIRFANPENAKKFKAQFEDAVKHETRREAKKLSKDEENLSDLVKKVEISEDK